MPIPLLHGTIRDASTALSSRASRDRNRHTPRYIFPQLSAEDLQVELPEHARQVC